MPELPEVETVRRGLLPVVGRRIVACDLRRRDVVRDRTVPSINPRRGRVNPTALGVGSRIDRLERRGKQLAIVLRSPDGKRRDIVIQLGMSGQLELIEAARIPNARHVHVVWTLDDARRLVFRDPRRFGGVTLLVGDDALERLWGRLGPDALTITARQLRTTLCPSRRAVKAALLDQGVLAGVGNIYADEALHRAGIDPRTPCNLLPPDRVRVLAGAIRTVLRQAIEARGSTLRDYRDARGQAGEAQRLHRVYAQAGRPCRTCGHPIAHCRIAQRQTCWCPVCQPPFG